MRVSITDEIGIYACVVDGNNDFIPMVYAADDAEGWYETEAVIDTAVKSRMNGNYRSPRVMALYKKIRVYKKGLKIIFDPRSPKWVLEQIGENRVWKVWHRKEGKDA